MFQSKAQVKGAAVQDELAIGNFHAAQAEIAPDRIDLCAVVADKVDIILDVQAFLGA